MTRLMAVGTVLVAVVLSGAAAGFWSGRWGSSAALREAAVRLEKVPLTAGDAWDAQPGELSEREIAIAELEGYLSRRYVNRRTGNVVSVLLVCGRPGPISAHTPDVCFVGAGYALTGGAKAYEPPAAPNRDFQVQDFQKTNVAAPTRLRVFMSWGHGKAWAAPANPRFAFAGKPYLYKLYVVREMSRAGEPLDRDPAAELIRDLLPQLDEVLFAGS